MRSNYIYIVKQFATTLAAFTVKHEMESYLKDYIKKDIEDIIIERFCNSDFNIVDITKEYYEDQD